MKSILKVVGLGKDDDSLYHRHRVGEEQIDSGFNAILAEAEKGNPLAQAEVGRRYRIGWGVQKNFLQALSWIQKSVEQNHPYGHFQLASLYNEGSADVPQDLRQARRYYEKAVEQLSLLTEPTAYSKNTSCADRLNRASWCAVGHLYRNGDGGVAVSYTKAHEWYQKAGRDVGALESLAWLYYDYRMQYYYPDLKKQFDAENIHWGGGSLVSLHYESVNLLINALKQGNVGAEYALGMIHTKPYGDTRDHHKYPDQYAPRSDIYEYKSTKLSEFAVTDIKEAVFWTQQAVAHGSLDAQVFLAKLYFSAKAFKNGYVKWKWEGLSTNDYDKEALRLLTDAANKGSWEATAALINTYELGWHEIPKDSAKALAIVREAANKGVPEAQYTLALGYTNGRFGLPKNNFADAALWHQKAAAKGYIPALQALIGFYEKNLGGLSKHDASAGQWYQMAVEENLPGAALSLLNLYENTQAGLSKTDSTAGKWYELCLKDKTAATKGDFWVSLGNMYEQGTGGMPKDAQKAFSCYQAAAEAGHMEAQRRLGECYTQGHLEQLVDLVQAEKWYSKAHALGSKEAGKALITLYCNQGRLNENSHPADAVVFYKKALALGHLEARQQLIALYEQKNANISSLEAAAWYEAEVNRGDKDSLDTLVDMYLSGRLSEDTRALSWYQFAANKGHKDAEYAVGRAHEQGRCGVNKDDKNALPWYERAAKQGQKEAQYALAQMHDQGRAGLIRDEVAALYWYEEAAKKGVAEAQYHAGRLYALGAGGSSRNLEKAREWYAKSSAQGYTLAATALANLAPPPSFGKPSVNALTEPLGALHISFTIPASEIMLQQELGRGGFGKVSKGLWRGHTEVAVKELYSHLSENAIQNFRQETEMMVGLRNPYIVQLYGITIDNTPYYMVMEYMAKGSLYSVLQSTQPLDWTLRQQMIKEISIGLDYLHDKNIVHRDLKSLNVLLTADNHAKITDFGLAKIKKEMNTHSTQAFSAVGSVSWMAPELFTRNPQYTEYSDVYSYGITVWEIASRKVPFADEANPAMIPALVMQGEREAIPEGTPEIIQQIITWCWKGVTNERPKIHQVVQMLQANPVPQPGLLPLPPNANASGYVPPLLTNSN